MKDQATRILGLIEKLGGRTGCWVHVFDAWVKRENGGSRPVEFASPEDMGGIASMLETALSSKDCYVENFGTGYNVVTKIVGKEDVYPNWFEDQATRTDAAILAAEKIGEGK